MSTRYQPRKQNGEAGPVFGSMIEASIWVILRDDMSDWDVELVCGEPRLIEIQEGLS